MPSPVLFDELIERLRREGFAVGTDQYLRMHELLVRDSDVAPAELKTRLCPIFVTNADEQQRFHDAYDDFFTTRARRLPTFSGTIARLLPRPPMDSRPTEAPRFTWFWIAFVVAVAVIAYLLRPIDEPSAVVAPAVETPVTTSITTSTREVELPPRDFAQQNRVWLLLLAAGLALLGAEVARSVMRGLQQRAHRGRGRPFDWPLREPLPHANRLFANQRFFHASRLLKGRERVDVMRLDVVRTIASTIRNLGDPVFEYVHDRRFSEYLFLVERLSERDHFAAYVHAMLDALARDGVLIEVYEHDGDPRHCWKPGVAGRIATADLHARFPQHRLIIVGRATALTNPVTGQALDSIPRLFPWTWRAILTPDEETAAVRRFQAYFDVYAIADNGLARLAERWQHMEARRERRRAQERRVVRGELPQSIGDLEELLPPALFAWLLRCSVHPTLHWDLTRALAPQMPAAELESALLELSRFPWFRDGRMPEPLRLALVDRLGENEEDEKAARTIALRLLASVAPPPNGSVAARVFQIQQLGHRIWRARATPSELRPLVRELRHYPPSHVARDGALMMLLRRAPGTLVAHLLPAGARRFLFRNGVPALGAHSFIGLLFVLPVLLSAGTALQQAPTTRIETITETVAATMPPPKVERPLEEPKTVAMAVEPSSPVVIASKPTVIASKPTVIANKPAVIVNKPTVIASTTTVIPSVVEGSGRAVLETPATTRPVLPDASTHARHDIPTLLAPNDEIFDLARVSDRITFTWQPAGNYTLTITDAASGKPVVQRKVAGAAWRWKPEQAGNKYVWSLTTDDGRTTPAVPFAVQYEVQFDPLTSYFRSPVVEQTLPASCTPITAQSEVTLDVRDGETIDSVEVQVLDKGKLETAEAKIVAQKGNMLVYEYRFVPSKACSDDDNVRVRISAKVKGTRTTRE